MIYKIKQFLVIKRASIWPSEWVVEVGRGKDHWSKEIKEVKSYEGWIIHMNVKSARMMVRVGVGRTTKSPHPTKRISTASLRLLGGRWIRAQIPATLGPYLPPSPVPRFRRSNIPPQVVHYPLLPLSKSTLRQFISEFLITDLFWNEGLLSHIKLWHPWHKDTEVLKNDERN